MALKDKGKTSQETSQETSQGPTSVASKETKQVRLVLVSSYTLTHPVSGLRMVPNEPFKHVIDKWITQMMDLKHIVLDED